MMLRRAHIRSVTSPRLRSIWSMVALRSGSVWFGSVREFTWVFRDRIETSRDENAFVTWSWAFFSSGERGGGVVWGAGGGLKDSFWVAFRIVRVILAMFPFRQGYLALVTGRC